jgi:hypothetical protein
MPKEDQMKGFLLLLSASALLPGCEMAVDAQMKGIHDQVAADAVEQYEIVSRDGSPIDKCVHAGMVAAAYVQAKDEPNYARWKNTENLVCASAGLPR